MKFHGRGGAWRMIVALSLGLGLCLGAGAQDPPAPVAQNPKRAQEYAKLEAKAPTQTGAKQAELLARLAEMDFAFAHDGYAAEQAAFAEQNLDRATQHADQAYRLLQAEAALGRTDGMKNVEVSLQKIGYGLHDLAQQVHFRERPAVQAAANHFADLRDQLLQLMFAPRKKG